MLEAYSQTVPQRGRSLKQKPSIEVGAHQIWHSQRIAKLFGHFGEVSFWQIHT